MSKTRAERARALEEWAERVEATDLKVNDTKALRAIAELADQRAEIEQALEEAVRSARRTHRTCPRSGPCLESPNRQPNASTARRADRQGSPFDTMPLPPREGPPWRNGSCR